MCVCVCDRHHGVVPAQRLSAGLVRSRSQTLSLSNGPPELHVPVRRAERPAGAERLLEVEFHQQHMDGTQKQVGDVTGHLVCPQLNPIFIVFIVLQGNMTD